MSAKFSPTDFQRQKALGLYEAGSTDAIVCKVLGIGRTTLNRFYKRDAAFRTDVVTAKRIADGLVWRSVFQVATDPKNPRCVEAGWPANYTPR